MEPWSLNIRDERPFCLKTAGFHQPVTPPSKPSEKEIFFQRQRIFKKSVIIKTEIVNTIKIVCPARSCRTVDPFYELAVRGDVNFFAATSNDVCDSLLYFFCSLSKLLSRILLFLDKNLGIGCSTIAPFFQRLTRSL